jgi:hypothetical protein
VQRLSLGRVAKSLDEMREAIRGLLEMDVDRHMLGRRARDFASREFTTGVAARYLELLDEKAPAVRFSPTGQTQAQGVNSP